MRRSIESALGLLELARLGAITRFRFKGPYWRWRWQTALGPGPAPSRTEIIRRLIRFGVWSRKMRTGRW
jgi:hypothetical protein